MKLDRMSRLLCVAALALAGSRAGADPLDSLVRIEDGKLLHTDTSLCTLDPSVVPGASKAYKLQIAVRSEAPARGVISRDNFVAYNTSLAIQLALSIADRIPGLKPSRALAALSCRTLESAIGEPDLRVETVMTKEGVQTSATNTHTGSVDRLVRTWDEIADD